MRRRDDGQSASPSSGKRSRGLPEISVDILLIITVKHSSARNGLNEGQPKQDGGKQEDWKKKLRHMPLQQTHWQSTALQLQKAVSPGAQTQPGNASQDHVGFQGEPSGWLPQFCPSASAEELFLLSREPLTMAYIRRLAFCCGCISGRHDFPFSW